MAIECKEKIISDDYVDFLIDFPPGDFFGRENGDLDYCYQPVDNRVGILSVNKNQLPDTTLLSNDYMSFPDLLGLQQEAEEDLVAQENQSVEGDAFDPSPLIESGITRVQEEPLDLSGRGVILAFADTGINYRNRIFRKEDGSTRLLALWDQTIQEGEPPEGFLYGTEYTREDIDRALLSQTEGNVLSVDENGHGTRLAALAAGSRIEEGSLYNSPAYQADIVAVKLKPAKQYLRKYYLIPDNIPAYASTDVMMAIKYIDRFVKVFRRPVVYCLGMGNNFRDHEGNGILSGYLNSVALQRSRIMVIAGGNEGNAAHHYRGSFANIPVSTEEDVEIFVSEGTEGFLLEIWTGAPTDLAVSIRTPGGEYIEPVSVLFQKNLRYRFVFEETVITVYNAYIVQGSGDTLVLMRFEKPTPGVWTIGVGNERGESDGTFDVWLPPSEFLGRPVYFLRPDPEITLTTPSYVSNAITVTAYNSRDNSIYQNAGRGFSRDNRVKPDLAAPGVDITIAGNRLGETPVIATYTGSSLAAAVTAGAAAQFAQWAIVDGNAPYIRSQELKNYFIRGATRDRSIDYPNPIWGYGRLNLYGAFDEMANI